MLKLDLMLEASDKHHLDDAEGWLGLGDWASANDALDGIQSGLCTHPDVLELRVQVYESSGQWAAAREVSRALTVISPERPFGWVHWAYALYGVARVREARAVLLSAEGKFPDDYLIRYSLACCSCRLGDFANAYQWLEKAVALAGALDVRQMALNNPDLQPLWDRLEKI